MLCGTDIGVMLQGKPLLQAAHLTAHPREISVIIGPNGSGKTTLLRALTGEIAHSGQVLLNGADIRQQKNWELAAVRAVLPQSTALAFPFTALEVVRLGLTSGVHGADQTVPLDALEAVGLRHLADQFFQKLSGGEQQRVQLARVLTQVWEPMHDGAPCWIFLDEPVASLDIAHQLLVMNLLRDFAKGGGGVVTILHDLNLTALYANSVTLLKKGRVAAYGRVAEVFNDSVLSDVYGCVLQVNTVPQATVPFLLPHAAREHPRGSV